MGLLVSKIKGAIPCGPKENPQMDNVKIVRNNDGSYSLHDGNTIKPAAISKDELAIKLPSNSLGRTWVMRHLVDKTGEYELTYRAPRKSIAKCDWTEFLTREEHMLIEELREKCEERRKEKLLERETESNDDLAAKLAKAKANYEKLLKRIEEAKG